MTITLGEPPADPSAPSGADVRLVIHKLGHALGLHHDRAPCTVMNRDPSPQRQARADGARRHVLDAEDARLY